MDLDVNSTQSFINMFKRLYEPAYFRKEWQDYFVT